MTGPDLHIPDEDFHKLTITKLEAAIRQIDCAIELWFSGGDEISVHTLLAAAYGILVPLTKHRSTGHETLMDLMKDVGPEIFPDVSAKDLEKAVTEAATFFKHANKDPESAIEFYPLQSLLYLMSCISTLRKLVESMTPPMRCFNLWLFLHRPQYLTVLALESLDNFFAPEHLATMRALSKEEFFKSMSEVFGQT